MNHIDLIRFIILITICICTITFILGYIVGYAKCLKDDEKEKLKQF